METMGLAMGAGACWSAIEDARAPADRARMDELNRLIREGQGDRPTRLGLEEAGFVLASDAQTEDAMAEEKRLCSTCNVRPLRGNNRSGICSRCRHAPKSSANDSVDAPPPTLRTGLPLTRGRSRTRSSRPASRRRACV
jgi:hypothetical protein